MIDGHPYYEGLYICEGTVGLTDEVAVKLGGEPGDVMLTEVAVGATKDGSNAIMVTLPIAFCDEYAYFQPAEIDVLIDALKMARDDVLELIAQAGE